MGRFFLLDRKFENYKRIENVFEYLKIFKFGMGKDFINKNYYKFGKSNCKVYNIKLINV